MNLRRTALASAIIASCAVLAGRAAQAQAMPALPALAASGAAAETQGPPPSTYLEPSLGLLVTGTNNANFGAGGAAQSDTIFNLVPRVVVQSDHAHWHLSGDFRLNGLYYVRGTQTNSVLPSGSLGLGSELVDRLLYLDASVISQQNIINPYVGQFSGPSSNQYTTTQYRLSPYIDRLLNPNLRFIARSDNTWTQMTGNTASTGAVGGRYGVQTVSLDQRPLPWGYTLVARQDNTIYDNQPYASLKDTSLRAIGNYAVSDRLVLGLIGGYEKVDAFLAQVRKPIYGARGAWQPDPNAGVEAVVEHRYFGTGWALQAHQGTGLFNVSLNWTRGPTTFLGSQFNSGLPGSNITTLLDGMLQSQYPDPVARARAVQTLLNSAGLPSSLSAADNFYTQSASLQNALSLTALMLRERNSYALSFYRTKTEDLFLPGQTLLQLLQTLSTDTVQTGVAFNYGRRLSPLSNLNFTVVRANNAGFGPNQGQTSRQTSFIVQLDRRLTPRTTGLIGLRRQFLVSSYIPDTNESAIFAGLVHRF